MVINKEPGSVVGCLNALMPSLGWGSVPMTPTSSSSRASSPRGSLVRKGGMVERGVGRGEEKEPGRLSRSVMGCVKMNARMSFFVVLFSVIEFGGGGHWKVRRG